MASSSKAKTDLGVKIEGSRLLRIGEFGISFKRTLRTPDDGKNYPLPPDLDTFPVKRVSDYADNVPDSWRNHGGVFLPMYQREAMFISFHGRSYKPNAVKVAVGKVDALTGQLWSEELHSAASDGSSSTGQDYLVAPPQPWLDGINSGDGTVRQFIAMPLGMGYSVEAQVTGEEKHGGLQLCVFEAKPGVFPDAPPPPPPSAARRNRVYDGGRGKGTLATDSAEEPDGGFFGASNRSAPSQRLAAAPKPKPAAGGTEMGLGAGGKMKQKIYKDPHGVSVWDQTTYARVFVHLCNSAMWRDITGEAAPEPSISAQTYARFGLPWFDMYDEDKAALQGSKVLDGVKSVKEMDAAKGFAPQQDDSPAHIAPQYVYSLHPPAEAKGVTDGEW